VIPFCEKAFDTICDGSADFEDQPAAGFQRTLRLRDQAFDYFEACGAGENRIARFEFADFKLYLVGFGFAHVGRIGYHEVESGIKTLQQIGLMKMNSFFELMAGGIETGDFESIGGNVGGVELGLREFFS